MTAFKKYKFLSSYAVRSLLLVAMVNSLVPETLAQEETLKQEEMLTQESIAPGEADSGEGINPGEASSGDDIDPGEASIDDDIDPEEVVIVDSAELKAFRDALATLESDQGAYANGLPEQLYNLALTLQQIGRHKEAITTFKRGIHLTRINQGLHSLEQIPFLRGEINSNMALGELSEADERQNYLLKVQQRSLPSGETLTEALMQQASWQQKAYELGIGGSEFSYAHLQSMWELYRATINDILLHEEQTSPKLLPPLNGLLKTQYLISAHDAQTNSGGDQINYRSRFDSHLSQNYKMGKAILLSIYEVELNSHGQTSLPVATTLVMTGDWMLWNSKRDSAHQAYVDAIQELSKLDDAKIHMEGLFGTPVPLPDIDGIRRLLPAVAPDEGEILLEFGVSKYGRVFGLTRLNEAENESEVAQRKAERLMRRIRKMKFRPRYDGIERVETEKILWAYDIN